MTESNWLKKAGKIHQTFVGEQSSGNGSKKITMVQAATINELQHAIGSHHGIQQVTYNEARASLDQMFDMVKAGRKTPPLSKG
jgi:hypothetical protein